MSPVSVFLGGNGGFAESEEDAIKRSKLAQAIDAGQQSIDEVERQQQDGGGAQGQDRDESAMALD